MGPQELPGEELAVDLSAHCFLALPPWDRRGWLLPLKDKHVLSRFLLSTLSPGSPQHIPRFQRFSRLCQIGVRRLCCSQCCVSCCPCLPWPDLLWGHHMLQQCFMFVCCEQDNRNLKEQNDELNGQIINLSIQGAKNLFSASFSESLAAEISSVSRDEVRATGYCLPQTAPSWGGWCIFFLLSQCGSVCATAHSQNSLCSLSCAKKCPSNSLKSWQGLLCLPALLPGHL